MSFLELKERIIGNTKDDGKFVDLRTLQRDTKSIQKYIFSTDDGSNLKKRLKIGNGEVDIGDATSYILGKGSFGTAYRATLKEINSSLTKCVVKIPSYLISNHFYSFSTDGTLESDVNKYDPNDKRLVEFYREIDYITRLRKGSKLVDSGITDVGRDISGIEIKRDLRDTESYLHKHKGHEFIHRLFVYCKGIMPCIVSEYCDGDLGTINQYMIKNKLLHEASNLFEDREYWKQLVYEIYQGISYMHSMHISHNDIKTENIFFKIVSVKPLKFTYRISDFGFCGDDNISDKLIGTPYYLSPELRNIQNHVRGATSNPCSNDAYAMALTCIEVLDTPGIPQTKDILYQIRNNSQEIFREITDRDVNLESLLAMICLSPEVVRLRLFNETLSKKLHTEG